MKNWKTTLTGWLSGAAVIALEYFTQHHVSAPTVATALALAGIGTAAKDSDVTGGTRAQ